MSSKVSATHLSVILSLELEWDAESTSDVQDVSMTQTSATPSTDADLPKNIEGKRCNAFSITDTCTWVHNLAEPFTEADKNFGITKKGIYKPVSDFKFQFIAEVICSHPKSSGFLIKLTPERNQLYSAESSERCDIIIDVLSLCTYRTTCFIHIGCATLPH